MTEIEKEIKDIETVKIEIPLKDFNNLMYLLGFAKGYFKLNVPEQGKRAVKAIRAVEKGVKKDDRS